MVVKAQVIHDVRRRFNQVSEPVEVNHLCFQCVIKRFHIRIVPAAAFTVLTDQQVMFIKHRIQLFIGKLTPPIRMEYGALTRPVILQRHQHSFPGELCITFAGEKCQPMISRVCKSITVHR